MPPRPLRAVASAETPETEDDPRIVAEVERALDAFRERLPPAALAALREDMLAFATTHPAMKETWRRARPRVPPTSSGPQRT
jgi:hypothetical protein